MKLLIIEDEPDLVSTLAAAFSQLGYITEYATDGSEGYELACINKYDLIILDLNLPSMDGIEILKAIRAEDKEQRILILSARSSVEDKVTGSCGVSRGNSPESPAPDVVRLRCPPPQNPK